MNSVFDSEENIVGKGDNQHSFPFLKILSQDFFLRVVKNQDCVIELSRKEIALT